MRIEQQHTLQDDEYKKLGEARRILAERFLDTVLLPVVKEEGEIAHEKFNELLSFEKGKSRTAINVP